MADATYDVVIIGGGNTALVLGMYLTKYGGMETVLLEERNELGGGWESIENAVPGYISSSHSFFHCEEFYRLPTTEDIPEFIEYGAQVVGHKGMAVVNPFNEDHTATGIYTRSTDPTGEKTAALLGQYSQRDAETWMAYMDAFPKIIDYIKEAECTIPDPYVVGGGPEGIFMRMLQDPAMKKFLDPIYAYKTPYHAFKTFFEAPENQQMPLRFLYSAGIPTLSAGTGLSAIVWGLGMAYLSGFVKGGTHNCAHAAQRVIKQYGGEYFTRSLVKDIIIENGVAKGVRLDDGTEIQARKAVISAGMSPFQLLDFLGRDNVDSLLCRKIDSLITGYCLIYWSWFVLQEKPHFKASDVMGLPEIDTGMWICPSGGRRDTEALIRQEARLVHLHEPPPYPMENPSLNLALIHPEGDHLLTPDDGKFLLLVEQHTLSPFLRDERWWHKHHEEMRTAVLDVIHDYAPNITQDSLVGYEPFSPWTLARLRNFDPHGNMVGLDHDMSQDGSLRPVPEWSKYKVPWVKNLYCSGMSWWPGGSAGDAKGYNCYKAIAEDFGLRQPGKEQGRPY